jgi:hypothetical protein
MLDQSSRARELGARFNQRRLQGIGVVGKVISGPLRRNVSLASA